MASYICWVKTPASIAASFGWSTFFGTFIHSSAAQQVALKIAVAIPPFTTYSTPDMQRHRYKAVSTEIALLSPCSPSERGEPATFLLPAPRSTGKQLRVRAVSLEEAKKVLVRRARNERDRFLSLVDLLQAIQSGDRAGQDLACQRLFFPVVGKGQDIVARTASEWLRNTPLSVIEKFVAQEAHEPVRALWLAGIRTLKLIHEQPQRVFCWEITSTLLENIHLVLQWDGQHFRPALYCEDRMSALYVRVLLESVGGRGFATCLKCGRAFLKERTNQQYCSAEHRDTHRISRWRALNPRKYKVQKQRQVKQRRLRKRLERRARAAPLGLLHPVASE